jgi:hypothetical protein
MICNATNPKIKFEQARFMNKQRISQIQAIEPNDPSRSNEVIKAAKAMSARTGHIAVVLLRIE